jgi:hypothetical protein
MKKTSSQRSPSPSNVAPRRNPIRTRSSAVARRSPSPSNVTPRRNPIRTRSSAVARRSPSPSNVAPRKNPTRTSSSAVARRSPSPKVAKQRSPSPKVAKQRSPSPKVAKQRSPSPSNVAPRKSPSQKVAKMNDPYSTPFWPPSDYAVPAKIVTDNPNPLPRTLAKHKLFLGELKNVLINEKIIDRDNPQFKELLEDQQKWNHRFYNLKPYNIICFVICDYHLYDKDAPRIFHKNNKEPYFGNYKFQKLLKYNRMNMKWVGNNILYIHKNRF